MLFKKTVTYEITVEEDVVLEAIKDDWEIENPTKEDIEEYAEMMAEDALAEYPNDDITGVSIVEVVE